MPDTGTIQAAPATVASADRNGRTQVLGFVSDAENEAALRAGLLEAAPDLVVHRGNSRNAIAFMSKMTTPRVLIVDISGEEQPMSVLSALSEVVEPDVRVLVIGDRQDVNLYRQLTRNLGVGEYLYKPLSAEVVAQHFGPFIAPASTSNAQVQGGRILTFTSVCGGAGATTLVTNLAWYLATEAKRHTVLLDTNLHTGTTAMLLGAKTRGGLRLALEAPERVDALFMERIATPVGERLSLIASEEKLTDRVNVAEGAVKQLLQGLRQRYNYIVTDLAMAPLAWHGELLDHARQRVLVMEPTLPAVRDALRMMALPMGAQQVRQSLIVLNKLGAPGTMTKQQVESALQHEVDAVVPFLPHVVNPAATMGTLAATAQGRFRSAIENLSRELGASSRIIRTSHPLAKLFRRGKVY